MTNLSESSATTSILMLLSCLFLGLLSGGMLLIGVSLISFWKTITPSEFQTWFASHSHLIGRIMIPFGIGSVAVTIAALVASWRGLRSERGWLLLATISAIGVMLTYPIFFAPTNAAFVRGGLSDLALRSMLNQWTTWHWIRTGFGVFAFFASLRALHR